MSPSETESKSIENANDLELVGKDKEGNFLVKHRQTRNSCTIVDTFAEMFPTLEISPTAQPLFFQSAHITWSPFVLNTN